MSADLIAIAEEYSKLYYDALLKDVVPFWLKNSLDTKHGGYFTCLDRDGKVFETDKFMWLQGREVYMFSKLYVELKNQYPTEAEEWLKAAKLGAEFLKQHGSDSEGRFYFSVTRKGEPIVQPYSIFSDCFAAIAFGAYFMASGEQWAKELTTKIYANIQAIKSNPKGQYNKLFPGTRDLTGLSLPMIDLNLSLELLHLIPEEKEVFTKRAGDNINYITNTFVDQKRNLLRENVFIGERKDSEDDPMDHFEGRVVNPGHVLEALWFLMTAAHDLKDTGLIDSDKLIAQCGSIMLSTLEFGWDKKYGGIFYFLDVDNKPTQQLEWDQKLWWVHFEALYAVAFAFYLTEKEEFAHWYHKLHEYLWSKFYDPPHGEFWGYLNRHGEVLLELKGGKWKGFFHVPRALLLLAQVFEKIQKIQKHK